MRYMHSECKNKKVPIYKDLNGGVKDDKGNFHVEVIHPITGKVLGKGFGTSKRNAEQYSAKTALEKLDVMDF